MLVSEPTSRPAPPSRGTSTLPAPTAASAASGAPPTGARARRSTIIVARRSYNLGGKHGALPAARAWRIVPLAAASYLAGSPPVLAGACAAVPAGSLDGAWPVWVRLTQPGSRAEDSALLMVDGIGWQFEPTGPGWRIEAVAAGVGPNGDRFVYAVETLDDEAHAHPIVGGGGAAPVNATLTNGSLAIADASSAPPIAGTSWSAPTAAADAQHATTAGRLLRITAKDGDVLYAIDASAAIAGNGTLLMAGATEYVRAGAALHYCDGPTAGGSVYVSELP